MDPFASRRSRGRPRKFYADLIAELVTFAQSEFKLSVLQEDGKPLRDHLGVLWRQSGECPKELAEAPPLPELAAHVWTWFLELHVDREYAKGEPRPIRSREFIDWMTLTGARPAPWEIRAIRAVDAAWRESQRHD